jgi:pilus assembly protein Flp/PilA
MCNALCPPASLAGTALTNGLRPPVALERGLRRLARARDAVTAMEYALMASLVAVAIIGGVAGYSNSLGTLMSNTFSQIAAKM